MTETLHPVKDAAQRLGISIWTLRLKAYKGDVASVKIGVKLLIPQSEIERLIQEGMRPRRSQPEVSIARPPDSIEEPCDDGAPRRSHRPKKLSRVG
jgi:hypothetical protein